MTIPASYLVGLSLPLGDCPDHHQQVNEPERPGCETVRGFDLAAGIEMEFLREIECVKRPEELQSFLCRYSQYGTCTKQTTAMGLPLRLGWCTTANRCLAMGMEPSLPQNAGVGKTLSHSTRCCWCAFHARILRHHLVLEGTMHSAPMSTTSSRTLTAHVSASSIPWTHVVLIAVRFH